MIIQDERGDSWDVQKGDPAWEYVSVLDRARFTKKALPRYMIQEPLPRTYTVEEIDAFTYSYQIEGPYPTLVVECIEYLRGRGLV